MAAVALAIRPGNSTSVTILVLFWLCVLVAVEAIARRNFVHLVLILLALGVLVSVVLTMVGLTFYFGWRVTVSICLGALAVLLLVANLQELSRT